jgi:choline dehydrogenase-like flavoprotein
MSQLPDPIREGLARGWAVRGGPYGESNTRIECDVVIVEEGPLRSSADFRQRESEAYPSLYQESAARKTADKAINILQGRCVGGSTTVNWTSSFRTPLETLDHWRTHFALATYDNDSLAPYFTQAEQRLNISQWLAAPNENNDILRRGAARLGIPAAAISRNVRGCWNLGSCGLGCPTNAKQSMLVTTIPAALDRGAMLLVETRAERFEIVGGRVRSLECVPVAANGLRRDAQGIDVSARHYVLAAGAINSPAVLLRSEAPDPHGRLGARTFLHPVVLTAATMNRKVEGWQGAPQSIYSDHFLHTQPIDGPMGFKLEAPPLHPVIFASTVTGFGEKHAKLLRAFAHTHVQLALLRDGFHRDSPGGKVGLRGDGSPVLDYPLTDYVMEGARRALLAMAEIQFAAGATQVIPVHELARPYTSWREAREAIAQFPMRPLLTKVMSAHVMGGCGLSGEEKLGVVRPDGVHWQIENLSVHDGSLFPTSIGANPQLSIYGIVNRLAQQLAQRLGGGNVILA